MSHDLLNKTGFQVKTGIEIKNTQWYIQSLTHRSALTKKGPYHVSNETLEFLGDAVLEFVVSKHLFDRFHVEREGFMTKLRSSLVCEKTLAKVAKELTLGDFLIMGKGEAASGGRQKDYLLANALEALIGALFLDQGLEACETFVTNNVLKEIQEILDKELYLDAKTKLQEYVQAQIKATPRYTTLKTEGPEHAKEFTVAVTIKTQKYLSGKGKTKQEAQEQAASSTLEHLKKFGFSK
jgi:ribonuclease-3